jgi:hypothetical protein
VNPKVTDFAERVLWTFLQALAGSIVAGGTAAALNTFDWRAALTGAGTAAGVCAVKVLLGWLKVTDVSDPEIQGIVSEIVDDAAASITEIIAHHVQTTAQAAASTASASAAQIAKQVIAAQVPAPAPVAPVATVTSPPTAPINVVTNTTPMAGTSLPQAPAPAPPSTASVAALSADPGR